MRSIPTGQGHTGNSARGRHGRVSTEHGARSHAPWRRVPFLAGLPALTVLALMLLAPAAAWAQDLPVVSVSANEESVTEGGAATFRLHRTGSTAAALSVTVSENYRSFGSELAGLIGSYKEQRDYMFAVGSSELTISVQASDNNWAPPAHDSDTPGFAPDVIVKVVDKDHYDVSADAGEVVTKVIDDDDPLLVDIAPGVATIRENNPFATFRVQRVAVDTVTGNLASYFGRSVTLTVGVTQTGEVIRGEPADVEVTLAPLDLAKVVTVALADDAEAEADGSVTLTIKDSDAFGVEGSRSATVTVIDDELPVVSVSANEESVPEGDTATFRLHRQGSTAAALTVRVSQNYRAFGSGLAAAGNNHAEGDYTFAVGSSELTISVQTLQNDWATPAHDSDPPGFAPDVIVKVLDKSHYQVSADAGEVVTKVIDDDPLLVDIAPRAASVMENDGFAEFVVRRIHLRSDDDPPVAYEWGPRVALTAGVTQIGGRVAGDAADVQVVLERSERQAVVRVALADDEVVGADGSVTLTIQDSDAFGVHGSRSATVTVTEDDARVTIAADAAAVAESVHPTFTLSRTGDLREQLEVAVDVVRDERNVQFYRRYFVTFAPGSVTATLTGYQLDDHDDEDEGTLTATIAADDGYEVGAAGSAVVRLIDNDPSPSVRIRDVSGAEGGGALELEVTAGYDGADYWRITRRTVTVSYATADGTATAGDDYTAAAGTLTFVPTLGNLWRPPALTIRVAIDDDAVHERDETFTVTLSAVVNAELPTATATATIANDDLPVVRMESLSPAEIVDGDTIRWRLRRDGYTGEALHVYLERALYLDDLRPGTNNGSRRLSGEVQTIPADSATVEGTLSTDAEWVGALGGEFIQIIQYADYAPSGLTPAPDAYLTHYDAEDQVVKLRPALPTMTIEAAAPAVTEGEDAVFVLRRHGPQDGALEVDWGWSGQQQGSPVETTATIAADADRVTVSVATDNDDAVKPDGAVWAKVLPRVATYRLFTDAHSPVQAKVTVRNDDPPSVTIAADSATVTEGAAAAFTLTRSADSGALTVGVTVSESGESLAGAPPARVSFPAGQLTASLSAATDDDDDDEPDGLVTARVAPGAGYTVGTTSAADVTVADNDRAQSVYFDVARSAHSVTEGQDVVFYLERRSEHGADDWRTDERGALVVNLQVAEALGRHVAGTLPSSVTFPAAASSVALTIATQDDGNGEKGGEVRATILSGAHYRRGENAWDTVDVLDNDTGFAAVGIAVNGTDVNEGADLVYTLTRHGGDLGRELAVRLSIRRADRGALAAGRSPFPSGGVPDGPLMELTIPANDNSVSWTWSTEDDLVNEGDAEVTVRVDETHEYRTGANSAPPLPSWVPFHVTTIVRDDDVPTVRMVNLSGSEIVEGEEVNARFERDSSAYTSTSTGDTHNFLDAHFEHTMVHRYLPPLSDRGTIGRESKRRIWAGQSELTSPVASTRADEVGPLGGWFEARLVVRCPVRGVAQTCTDSRYEIGEPNSLRVEIRNNFPGVYVVADAGAVAEGEAAHFTVTRVGGSAVGWTKTLNLRVEVTQDGEFIAGTTPTEVVFAGREVDDEPRETSVVLEIPTVNDLLDEADGAVTVRLLPSDCPGCLDPNDALELDYQLVDDTALGGADYRSATVAILDDDLALRLAIEDAEAVENEGGIEFAVTLGTAAEDTVTTFWRTADGTATAGDDYTAETAGVLTFSVGDTRHTITVPIADDTLAEADETLFVELYGATNITVDRARAAGTITDDDLPSVTVATDPASVVSVVEGTDIGFVLTRDGDLASALQVGVRVSEEGAYLAADAQPAGVAFAPGAATARLTVATDDDTLDEEDGAVSVELPAGDRYRNGDPAAATATVTDDDEPPALAVADAAAPEGAGEIVFTALLDTASGKQVTVAWSTAEEAGARNGDGGAAWEGIDYQAASGTLTFAPGALERTVTVTLVDDEQDEPDERFAVALSEAVNATAGAAAHGTIEDDDLPVVTVAAVVERVEEGAAAGFTVTRAGDLAVLLAVPLTVSESGSYLSAEPAAEVRFEAGQRWASLLLATVDDAVDEEDGAVTVTVDADADYVSGDPGSAQVVIGDDDAPPELSIADARAVENAAAGALQFTVALSAAGDGEVTVAYATADGTATAAEPADYVAAAGTLTFASGVLERTVTVALVDDVVDEDEETFTVALSGARQAILAGGGQTLSATGTIADDDAAPELSIAAARAAENVAAAALEFTVALSAASERAVTVAYATADGTATAAEPADYVAAAGTLTFAPGALERTVTVALVDDVVDEDEETFTVALSGARQAALAGGGESLSATGIIADDDAPPELAIAAVTDPARVAESGGSLAFRVTLSAASERVATVAYETVDGAATADADYTATGGVLVFAAGTTGHGVTVAILDDTRDEADETFDVQLREAQNATIAGARATATITDDDPTPTLAIAAAAANEGAGSLAFRVTLSAASGLPVTVAYATADGTALAVADYTAASGSLAFGSEETQKIIRVLPADDELAEADETFTVTLSDAVNATAGPAQATGTITDDDRLLVSVAAAAPAVTAGADALFTVTATGATSSTDLEVDYAVAGTAAAGDDYTQPSGSLTIPAGAARGTITIATLADADAVADPDVTLIVSLVAAATTGTTVVSGSPAATTIEDDDHAPAITGTALTVAENQTAVATLAASDADGDELAWSIPSGTAGGADGAHFTLSAARVLAFKAAKDYENPDDADGDGAYELTVRVSDGHNPVTAAVTVTLTDVVPAVTIATDAGQATEGDTVAYTVTRSGDLTGALSVTVTVSESGGAVLASGEAGARQVAFSGTAATAAVSVATVDDAVDEPDSTVTATLTAAAGYTVGADNAAAVTVADDDAAPEVAGEALAVGEGVTEVATLTATDADLGDGTLQWEIPSGDGGGADAAHFTLTGAGVLAFKEAKDYENPDDADGDGAYELTVQVSDGHNPVTAALTVTLTDVVPAVTIAADAGQATEGDTVAYTVTRSGDLTGALSVTVTVSETGGAVLASGEAGARQVAFSGTAATVAVSVGTVDDAVDEPDATVTATLTAAAGYTVGADNAAAVTVADDEELDVSVTGPASVAEGAAAQFTVTVAGGTSAATAAVSYTVAGTATAGTDYTAPSGTLTLAAGAAAGTITVATLDDGVLDPGETLEVTLESATTAARTVAVSGSPATTTIVDDGTATVSVATATATEGAELAFTVALTGAVAADVELGWSTADDTAAAGDDYTAVSEGTLTIAGGRTMAMLTVATVEDTLAEAAETFTVTLSAPAAGLPAGVSLGTASATGTIADDDPLTASVSAAAATVMEGEAASFTVALSGGTSTAAVAVAYTVGGTATAGDDYAPPAGTLTLAAGAADGTISIATKRDEEQDPSETLEVTLSGASTAAGTVRVDPTAARTTIANEGTELVLGEVRALLEPATVTEGEVAQFAVTLSGTVTAAQELSWTTVDDGTATAGDDYTAASGTLTFLPDGAVTQTIEVTTTEDALAEETETFSVSLGTAKVTGAIEDDDYAPAITGTALTVAENQTAVATLAASDADGDELTWSLPSGTAGGVDAAQFTLSAAGVLAFKEAKDYENPDDADGDGAYELTVQVSDGHNPVTAAVTVTLTDVVPEVTIAADAGQATEGDTVAYTVTRSGDLSGALSVTVTVSEAGGAVLASGEGGARQVAFSGTAATAPVSVATVDDTVDEPDATVTATLTAAAGYTVGTDATAAVTVADDDTAGIVLTPTELEVTEGESETYTVELATEPSGQVTVTVGGETGTDLTVVNPSLTFTASTWNTAQTVEVRADQDDDGSNDSATLTHTAAGAGYGSVSRNLAVTVTDDETAGIALTTVPTSVREDASETEVTVIATLGGSVTLSGATEVTVSVGGGTATSGTDYTAVENFKLTIAATESSGTGTFTLTPTQDSISEDDETIDVTGAASGFTVTKAEMTLTDDETAPTAIALTTAPSSVAEDDSATEVTVTATLGGSVTLASATEVTVSVGGGSATSGTDYTAVENFKLTIAATESSGTGTFTLTPTQDSISEDDETIDVTGTASGFTVTKAEMTLTDDETAPGTIALTTAPSSVAEDDSATEVTVTATLGGSVTLAGATEVTVSVGGGTCTSGTDYTAVADFKLTIAATESSGTGTFTLTPTQDSISEDDETIDVTGAASGFTVTKAEMTLTDDETAPTDDRADDGPEFGGRG